jgi:hypothetical protein
VAGLRRPAPAACWVVAAALPAVARAHAPIPGIEGFYVGLAHPATEPVQLFALLSLSLLLGTLASLRFRRAWAAMIAGAGLGALSGVLVAPVGAFDTALLAMTLVSASLALFPRPPAAALLLPLCAVIGFLLGQGALPDPGALSARAVTLAGALVSILATPLVLHGLCALALGRLRRAVVTTGLRIAQAWILAIALLLLAFLFVR